jgi:hypothetical protein
VDGEKYFMDIFINKDYDAVTMYQKTQDTEELLRCRTVLLPLDVGTEVQDFYKYLEGELPCLIK